jgi:tRNA isopentenyl-2-thiomethyl-A-37 hydroxylase MiaE
MDFPFPDLLSVEQVYEIDCSLLPAREKFAARVALYALQVYRQIAATEAINPLAVSPEQVQQWLVEQGTHEHFAQQSLELDEGFLSFWTQLLASARRQLQQIVKSTGTSIDDLDAKRLVAWFEGQLQSPS